MKKLVFVTLALLSACEVAPEDKVSSLDDFSKNKIGSDAATTHPSTADAGTTTKSDSGTIGDASVAPDTSIPFVPGVCNPNATFAAPVKVAVGDKQVKSLSAITANELSIAWITPTDGVVHYADRDDASDSFGSEQTIDPSGIAAGERVALSQDGLILYAMSTNGHTILAFTRGSRGDAFTGPSAQTVSQLNTEGAALGSNERFSDITVASSSTTLVFRHAGGSSPSLRMTRRVIPTDSWSATSPFAVQSEFAAMGSLARHPTGLSSDARTVFYFDEASGNEKAAFFDEDAVVATVFVNEGARWNLQPNADCTVLYYDSSGEIYALAKQ